MSGITPLNLDAQTIADLKTVLGVTNSVSVCKSAYNIEADVQLIIPGASFGPVLNKEPISLTVIDSTGIPVDGVQWSYALNGLVYDITILISETLTAAKINVLC